MANHLGSPRVITDGRGAVIARHDYMAFGADITETIGNVGGRTTAQGFNSADEVRKQYTGYERDDESKLDYAQARYYNSSHGRFTSVDPLTASASIRNPQTFNRYSYVLNSPYKFVDPLGLISENAGSPCGNRCRNSDGGSGGGFVGLYSDAGQTIGIGRRTEGAGPITTKDDPPPAPGVQSASDITATVKIATEHSGVLEDGTEVIYMLPSETQSNLQADAESAEQTSIAQSQNSTAALQQLKSEYEHLYKYKNPKLYALFGVVAPDFKANNGTIIPFTPPDVGFSINVGPVTPTNSGLDSGYSAGTLELVKAANSQLQEVKQMLNNQTSEDFAAKEIKTRGINGVLPVTFRVVGSKNIQNGTISKATLISLHKQAVGSGISVAHDRLLSPKK